MAKAKKSTTKTIADTDPRGKKVVSRRKKTTGDTRSSDRQRSGNNGPQQGSH
jgi:hypothetical protein